MSGVFQNIDPPPPGECVPPALGAGGGYTRWVERGVGAGGSIFWKTPDTALYYTYVSTMCLCQYTGGRNVHFFDRRCGPNY
jgi:hypothetical protein